MSIKLSDRAKGFTLVEIIIVVAITALLTGVLFSHSQRSREQINLNIEKAKIAQLIGRTKSLAIAGFTDPPTIPPPCAYGFEIDHIRNTYGIFTYDDPNISCRDISNIKSLNTRFFKYLDPVEPVHPDIDILAGPAFTASTDVVSYILLIPPELNVLLFGDSANLRSSGGAIYLQTQDGSFKSEIRISANGQLSF